MSKLRPESGKLKFASEWEPISELFCSLLPVVLLEKFSKKHEKLVEAYNKNGSIKVVAWFVIFLCPLVFRLEDGWAAYVLLFIATLIFFLAASLIYAKEG